jgi:putative addiction module component (TIGR02574 family)
VLADNVHPMPRHTAQVPSRITWESSVNKPLATLEAEALKLPPEERVLLADHLLASVGAHAEVEQVWAEEVDRRLAEVEAGHVELVPLEQAMRRARQALS